MCIGTCRSCFIHHYFYLIQLFLEASSSSMQIICVPDFLSKVKHTKTLLCKQSQYFRALQLTSLGKQNPKCYLDGFPMGAVKCTLPPGRLVAALRLQVSIPWPLLLPWVTTHPAGCLCYHGILPPTSGPRTNPRPLGNSPSAPESIRILLDLTSLVHSLPSKASPGPYTLKSGKKKISFPQS